MAQPTPTNRPDPTAGRPKAQPTETSLSTNQDAIPGAHVAPNAVPHTAPETQVVTTWKVACSGDEALGLGHPRVWLAISDDIGWVECGYCDKRFVIDRAQAHADH